MADDFTDLGPCQVQIPGALRREVHRLYQQIDPPLLEEAESGRGSGSSKLIRHLLRRAVAAFRPAEGTG